MRGQQKLLARVVTSAFLVVALVLAMGVVALAQDPMALGGTEVAATLQGNSGGAFHHYTVAVPADTQVHIQFWYPGVDPLLSAAVGVEVFGSDGSEGLAVPVEDGAYLEYSFQHDDAQTLTVVAFNYTDRAIPYTLKVDGLPMTMAEAPAQALPATGSIAGPARADMPADDGVNELRGTDTVATLQGSTGGAFNRYTVAVPADTEVHIQFWFPGVDPLLSSAIGVQVLSSDGSEGLASPVEDGAYLEYSFRHDDPQTLTVVVFNYTDKAIPYTIKVAGLPMTTAQAQPQQLPVTGEMDDAEDADMPEGGLAIGGAASSGLLVGDEGGAFARIPLMYKGDESDVTITLNFSPSDPSFGDRLGVEVWGPNGNLLGTGTNREVGGEHKVTFASDVAGQYTIVVFNYMEGVPISYSLTSTR